MLKNVLQWQQPSRLQRSPNRWLTWTQRLNQGRDRLPQRHSPLSLTLRDSHPFLTNSPGHSHWQTHIWQFYPQIHLSITPLLRELSHQSQTSWVFQSRWTERITSGAIAPLEARQPQDPFPWRRTQSSVSPIHREFIVSQFPKEQVSGFGEQSFSPSSSEMTVFRVSSTTIPFNPLQQAFRRVRQHPITPVQTQLLTQENSQFVQRITHNRQRVEETRLQTSVVHQGVKPSEPREAIAPLASMPSAMSANSSVSDRPPSFLTPSPPAINLEQLTDQVMRQLDSRIVAQRERMGRTF
jgi:hypothetical protein